MALSTQDNVRQYRQNSPIVNYSYSNSLDTLKFILGGVRINNFIFDISPNVSEEDELIYIQEHRREISMINSVALQIPLLDVFLNNDTLSIDEIKSMQGYDFWLSSLMPLGSPALYFMVELLKSQVVKYRSIFEEFIGFCSQRNLLCCCDVEDIMKIYNKQNPILALKITSMRLPLRHLRWFEMLLKILDDWRMPDFRLELKRRMDCSGFSYESPSNVPRPPE